MGRCWSFRGDDELDHFLEKWSKQHEKSFHIRQALRKYLSQGSNYYVQVNEHVQPMPIYEGEVELCFDD